MHEKLRKKLAQMIEEEERTGVDRPLLDTLLELAAGETFYDRLGPVQRNTLNEFFRQVREYVLAEVLTGKYGTQIVLDAVIIICFETGYKLRERETLVPPSP